MYGINLSPTEAIIEFILLVLFPIILWGLYKMELYRDKKRLSRPDIKH